MDMECAAYNLNETRSNRMKIYVLNITDFDRREIQHHLDRHRHSVPRKKVKIQGFERFHRVLRLPNSRNTMQWRENAAHERRNVWKLIVDTFLYFRLIIQA